MEYLEQMETNQRTCPVCNDTITYATVVAAVAAAAKNGPCGKCKYATRKAPVRLSCPKCSYSSKRTTNFEAHLVEAHSLTTQQAWDDVNGGPVLCACGCGGGTTFKGWKDGYGLVIVGHNANLRAVYGEEKAAEISEKRKAKLRGRTGWSSGLTKETDERVAARGRATSLGRKRAFNEGKIVPWSKGLTKETDERIAATASEVAKRFATGELIPWAKGLKKDTDERIRTMALKVSLSHQNKNLRERLDEIKRLKLEEVKERIESGSTLVVVGTDGVYVNDAQRNIIVRCASCGDTWSDSLRRLQHGRCYRCDPGGSLAQHAIASWIGSLGVEVTSNCRSMISPQELDVYVPAHKLAVEYNGLYWHNINQKSSTYHQNKSDKCAGLGITLFHVFEDEWRDKRPIIESMIRHRLGMTARKVAARKCTVRRLQVAERQAFFNTNHIDGDTNAKLAVGLFSGDELVAAMSLRTPFHKKHGASLEVARMCGKLNVNVQGSLSRLTKAAAAETKSLGYSSMLSYVDARFGGHGSWSVAGWKQTSETSPRFWWTDDVGRFNRFKFRADKKNGLTEEQVASAAGVVRIYGCKNFVLEHKVT